MRPKFTKPKGKEKPIYTKSNPSFINNRRVLYGVYILCQKDILKNSAILALPWG